MSVCVYLFNPVSKPLLTVCSVCWCALCLLSTAKSRVSPVAESHPHTHGRAHRGGSTVARGGQNPAAFSYLWPIKSHVIWWLSLMGNGWNPSLSFSLIISTLNGVTVKIRWCHHVRSLPVCTIQHLTLSTYTVCGFLKKRLSRGNCEECWRDSFTV